jgi:hypothetical protein
MLRRRDPIKTTTTGNKMTLSRENKILQALDIDTRKVFKMMLRNNLGMPFCKGKGKSFDYLKMEKFFNVFICRFNFLSKEEKKEFMHVYKSNLIDLIFEREEKRNK